MHEAEQNSQGGRLARAVRTEEAGDRALADGERQTVDGRGLPVALAKVDDLDHARTLSGQSLDEPVDTARLGHELDLELTGDDRPVPEQPAGQALLDLDRTEPREPDGSRPPP